MLLPLLALFAIPLNAGDTAGNCAGSAAVSNFRLTVQPTEKDEPKPLREVHFVPKDSTLRYQPGQLPAHVDHDAQVAVVLAPVNRGGAKKPEVLVLEPKSALQSAEWKMPDAAEIVVMVYGPQGLDAGRVKKLVREDEELISQLANYAEKTATAEALIEQLTSSENSPVAPSGLEAAMNGLSARFGQSFVRVDRTAPAEQQFSSMMATLNPALSGYDPLAQGTASRVAQSTTLAASVAGMFFDNTVGLAVGSAALAQNLRTLLFPNTDFRSSFIQVSDTGNLTMCAKREARKSRTRMAYLWAERIPNVDPPVLKLGPGNRVAAGGITTITGEIEGKGEWATLTTVKGWNLVRTKTINPPVFVPVTVDPQKKAITVDLAKAKVEPGEYRFNGSWDWSLFPAGMVVVEPQPDLSKAKIDPVSADRLIAGAAKQELRLQGVNFEFLKEVALESKGAEPNTETLTFTLPKGPSQGEQTSVVVHIDPEHLKAGEYKLKLTQGGATPVEIPVRILPPHPAISSLPLRVNLGEKEQKLVLKGTGLERIEGMTSKSADLHWASTKSADGGELKVSLKPGLKTGDRVDAQMKVEGVSQPVEVKGLLAVAPARPRIAGATMSRAQNLGITEKPQELPADSFVTFALRVDQVTGQPQIHVGCADQNQTLAEQNLRPGERNAAARLESTGANGLFLSFLPGAVGQPGCELRAEVTTAETGTSDPKVLGHVVRLPKIDKFTLTDEKTGEQTYAGVLEGEHLESISQVGWDAEHGLPVEALPAPVSGDSQKQTLKVNVPWPAPAPKAPLYVWLQGETEGRKTESRY